MKRHLFGKTYSGQCGDVGPLGQQKFNDVLPWMQNGQMEGVVIILSG